MTLLDTHAWFWLVTGDEQLNARAQRVIEEADQTRSLYLSPISLWEIALKHSRGKLETDRPIRPWLHNALSATGVTLLSIDVEITAACAELPASFHGDPADRIIAATARHHGMQLVTHDKKLLSLARRGFLQAIAT